MNKITLNGLIELLEKDGFAIVDYLNLKYVKSSIENEEDFYSLPIVQDCANCIRLNKRRGVVKTSIHNVHGEEFNKYRDKYVFEIIKD